MDVDVSIFLEGSDDLPHVTLSAGDQIFAFPWPVWEMLVHRASHKYVSWALGHPEEYAALEHRMASIGGYELELRRQEALHS